MLRKLRFSRHIDTPCGVAPFFFAQKGRRQANPTSDDNATALLYSRHVPQAPRSGADIDFTLFGVPASGLKYQPSFEVFWPPAGKTPPLRKFHRLQCTPGTSRRRRAAAPTSIILYLVFRRAAPTDCFFSIFFAAGRHSPGSTTPQRLQE
ncbi:hypothetical protein B0H15DRAFT_281759 [Mycena belliarum]|uniref:Uncharacterized protein n=1 Tax=Mycena belliarum TaxID=1033014 RepID=A0AAD6U3I1_9AGAR|nr:hypothetical protein B0H15DRAFT_281759 [Mycena belliae]